MIELFNDLPESVKNTDRAFIDFAFLHNDAKAIAQIVNNFINSTSDELEIDFIDFYFKMKLEERNASNSN